MAKVLFRVDAGQIHHVAMGHASRCVSLAQDLHARGYDMVFLMRDDPQGQDFVRSRGFDVVSLNAELSAKQSTEEILGLDPDLVIFDLLHANEEQTRALVDAGVALVVVDDLGHKTVHADLIVNSHLLSCNHVYEGRIASQLLGPSYCILGSQFDGLRNVRANHELDEIVVTMGGADPMGFTEVVLNTLVEMDIAKRITVVKGPAFAGHLDIKNLKFGMKTQVRVQENVPNLSMLMVAADLVVSACGRTAYELAATGTPCVLVPTAPHEVEVAQALVDIGAALAVSSAEQKSIRCELEALVQTAAQLAVRQEMAQAGLQLIDGQGRKRVTTAMMELQEGRVGIGRGRN